MERKYIFFIKVIIARLKSQLFGYFYAARNMVFLVFFNKGPKYEDGLIERKEFKEFFFTVFEE